MSAPAPPLPSERAQSLAVRLTRALILWVGGVWLLCALGVTWYTDREINFNFDDELVEVSHRMFDIALEHLDAEGPRGDADGPLILPAPGSFADADLLYQLVEPDTHRVLARSAEASAEQFDVPLAPGFESTHAWRVYTLRHPTRPIYMQVADPLRERREAVNRTLFGLIIAMVAMLPLLALLLQRIARRELRVLDTLKHEISLRNELLLTPIDLPGLPRELRSVEDHRNNFV